MQNDRETRERLRNELVCLMDRFIEYHKGNALDGLADIGEILFRYADWLGGRGISGCGWLALLLRLQKLSG